MKEFFEWAVNVLVEEYNWKRADAEEWINKTNYYPYPVSFKRYMLGDY